jgi:hypothetical protein
LTTLYSRELRIGLNVDSYLLCGPSKSLSLDSFIVVGVGVLAYPAFELLILPEQELEGFTDDVRRLRIDELRIPVQVVSDFLLQTNLKGCSLWLL